MRTEKGSRWFGMPDLEKVIEGLKCCFENAKCDGCPYEMECRKILFKTPENHCPILDDVLALLKEKEPVKPEVYYVGPDKYRFYNCPVCKMAWYYKGNSCLGCGRPVKWDD